MLLLCRQKHTHILRVFVQRIAKHWTLAQQIKAMHACCAADALNSPCRPSAMSTAPFPAVTSVPAPFLSAPQATLAKPGCYALLLCQSNLHGGAPDNLLLCCHGALFPCCTVSAEK